MTLTRASISELDTEIADFDTADDNNTALFLTLTQQSTTDLDTADDPGHGAGTAAGDVLGDRGDAVADAGRDADPRAGCGGARGAVGARAARRRVTAHLPSEVSPLHAHVRAGIEPARNGYL